VDNTVARFHISEPKWDGSYNLDPTIAKELYRTPCSDPSGRRVNLGRDEAKGVPTWAAVNVDRLLPVPQLDLCTDSFRGRLVDHVEQAAKKVEQLYVKMPENNDRQRQEKARTGADLSALQRTRDLVLEDNARIEAQSKDRSRSPSPSRSRNKM
jgi:hypothetical protein